MSLQSFLSELPKLSDLIWEIEKWVVYDPAKRYGNWGEHPVFPDEDFQPWTQAQWDRYGNFIKAGRENGFLPKPDRLGLDAPPPAFASETPFSPLAMKAALEICGYSQKTENADDFRVLAQAMVDLAQAELEAFFAFPEASLQHVQRHALKNKFNVENLKSAGETVAYTVKQTIQSHLLTISTWSNVLDRLDKVDWNDERVLMNLASDPNFAEKENTIPLCTIMLAIENHESMSGTMLGARCREWWDKGDAPAIITPSAFHQHLRAKTKLPERELQARSLDQTSRFERAIVRVCRPSLHAAVPFQISLLDMEQLLLEKPTRSHQLSEPLMKAIGYHAMVVHAHYILRTYVFEKASACSQWHTFNLGKRWGIGSADSRTNKPITTEEKVQYMFEAYERGQRTFRDERVLWFMTSGTGSINWAHYLHLDSTLSIPTMDGAKLKSCLDAISTYTFGCKLVDLMKKEETEENEPVWMPIFDNDDADIQADVLAILEADDRAGWTIIDDLKCIYRPEPSRRASVPPKASADLSSALSSLSMGQSGHSYLRDNPSVRSAGRRNHSADSSTTLGGESADDQKPIVFSVNNKQLKLVERLFGKREGKVSWSALVNLFKRLGFYIRGMGGSAHHLTQKSPEGKSLILYRPHPVPEFTAEQASSLGERLESTFGWSIENFGRTSKTSEVVSAP